MHSYPAGGCGKNECRLRETADNDHKLEHGKYRKSLFQGKGKMPDPTGPALSRRLDEITSSHPFQTQLFHDSNEVNQGHKGMKTPREAGSIASPHNFPVFD